MQQDLKNLLKDGIVAIKEDLYSEELFSRLCRLYDEITLFNPKYALVNAEGRDLVIRHILDCLAPYPIISSMTEKSAVSYADLGSGSGLPGLVLASAFPCWKVSLVERMGRRAGFLRNTIAAMGLADRVDVIQSDLEKVTDKFDVISFRAFRPFEDIISDLDRIMGEKSLIFCYKSTEQNIREELCTIESYGKKCFTSQVVDYSVPMLDAQRKLLVVGRP